MVLITQTYLKYQFLDGKSEMKHDVTKTGLVFRTLCYHYDDQPKRKIMKLHGYDTFIYVQKARRLKILLVILDKYISYITAFKME